MPPQEVGDRCIITPGGYAVHSSRLGLLWITLLSGALAIRAPFLIRLPIIIRALIGYSDNITAEFIAYCMDKNILLMILPPHSSHLTQPLDVGVFGALKKHMATEIEPLMRTGITRIQKVEWLTAFVAAHDKAVSAKNILSGFRGTGIHPFLPTKVLRRVAPSSPSPSSPSRPSTPQDPLTPFNEAVFTDSPVDFNAVQRGQCRFKLPA